MSGGVGEDEQLLDSVEFFALDGSDAQTWKEMAPLKMPRTEHGNFPPNCLNPIRTNLVRHESDSLYCLDQIISNQRLLCEEKVEKDLPFFTGMSVIASLPTVVGGVSSDEFLASVEVLDNSARSKKMCKKSSRR